MKIEKMNEHQIRCTLTKDDLAKRQLKLSELAYGTEKAKILFKDMMEQAAFEFGFETEDIPLMIEAIPMSSECIVLVITKVENPEELDTRFSKFMPQIQNGTEDFEDFISDLSEQDSEVLDLFRRIQESRSKKAKEPSGVQTLNASSNGGDAEIEKNIRVSVMYSFSSLAQLIKVSRLSKNLYDGISSLYKDIKKSNYILVITNSENNHSSFNKICNMLSEYGEPKSTSGLKEEFLLEHHTPILVNNALQTLARL